MLTINERKFHQICDRIIEILRGNDVTAAFVFETLVESLFLTLDLTSIERTKYLSKVKELPPNETKFRTVVLQILQDHSTGTFNANTIMDKLGRRLELEGYV